MIHGQFLYPPAANDIDLYRFEVPESGRVTAEIVAERMTPSSSLLDATLTLYQEKVTPAGVTREVIARNDDYYSSDSWLDLWLEAGNLLHRGDQLGQRRFRSPDGQHRLWR